MLKGNLYDITSLQVEEGKAVALIHLRGDCAIFVGHFPGRPITPGVCLVQTAKELAETLEGHALHLSEAKDIKFASLVTPGGTPDIRYEMVQGEKNAGSRKWQVSVFSEESLCCKMSLVLGDQ